MLFQYLFVAALCFRTFSYTGTRTKYFPYTLLFQFILYKFSLSTQFVTLTTILFLLNFFSRLFSSNLCYALQHVSILHSTDTFFSHFAHLNCNLVFAMNENTIKNTLLCSLALFMFCSISSNTHEVGSLYRNPSILRLIVSCVNLCATVCSLINTQFRFI